MSSPAPRRQKPVSQLHPLDLSSTSWIIELEAHFKLLAAAATRPAACPTAWASSERSPRYDPPGAIAVAALVVLSPGRGWYRYGGRERSDQRYENGGTANMVLLLI